MNKKVYKTPEIKVFKVNTINMIAASGEGYSSESASGADQMGREGGDWFSED